jgi:tetratricopeptide (TPR) repeat protein
MLAHLNAVLADRYAVEREIGRGGMASVWLARDLRHERPVAIKVLHPELAGAIGVDRFVREVRLTARLQHPAIVPVLDSGVFAGPGGVQLPWYAMPYLPGESLRARLERERHLPIDEALRITDEAARALAAAHREGIVHRDIKPENVLLSGEHVYLADFGIAKALIETGGERLTSTGLAIGTPAYMSPEQAAGSDLDARTDQYSLACVLYEMLAGEPPFTGPTAQAIVARRMSEPARAIRPVRSSVPVGLESALLRALERVPVDRFSDVATFAAALRDAPAPPPARPRPSRRVLWGGIATAVLGVIAIALWIAAQGQSSARRVRNPEVVALYQRGMRGYDRRTPEGVLDAIQAFDAAVKRDSTFGAAWAGLARAYVRAYERGFIPREAADSVLRLAVTAVDAALLADHRNADAWMTRSVVSRTLDPTDATPVIRAARRAVALDPNSAPAWHVLGVALAEAGDPEAHEAWRRSVIADPTYTQGLGFMAQSHYWRGQFDSAAVWADSAIAVDPNYILGRSTAGYVAIELGRYRRAEAAFEAVRRLSTGVEVVNAMAGGALAKARDGRAAEARATLAQAESLSAAYEPVQYHTVVYFAQVYAALGEPERAFAWLRRFAPKEHLHFQQHLRCDPPFAPIAADPRFRALLIPSMPEPGRHC